MKYLKLEPPCDKCLGCQRLENSRFKGDKNCKWQERKQDGRNKNRWNTN